MAGLNRYMWSQPFSICIKLLFIDVGYMTIGIVTAKRPNSVTYLYNTLYSLLQNAAKEDKKDIYIIILLADFDDDWRRNVTNKIKELYSDDVQKGTIQVLQSFSWMYPKSYPSLSLARNQE